MIFTTLLQLYSTLCKYIESLTLQNYQYLLKSVKIVKIKDYKTLEQRIQ